MLSHRIILTTPIESYLRRCTCRHILSANEYLIVYKVEYFQQEILGRIGIIYNQVGRATEYYLQEDWLCGLTDFW